MTTRTITGIPNGIIGILLFIATELMFFGGLISAFIVIKSGNAYWPPLGQPRLPIFMTGLNTVILLASGMSFYFARRNLLQSQSIPAERWLRVTVVLGAMFLVIQGTEWAKLISYGLTAQSSIYGSIFYLLIGMHALHAFCGLIALFYVLRRTLSQAYSANEYTGFEMAFYFWVFVVGLWPILYGLVYLS